MSQATTQSPGARESRHRHTRHRRSSVSRVRPATWRKIGAYVLVYAIAVYVCWTL